MKVKGESNSGGGKFVWGSTLGILQKNNLKEHLTTQFNR
jgi:hypothetical protein